MSKVRSNMKRPGGSLQSTSPTSGESAVVRPVRAMLRDLPILQKTRNACFETDDQDALQRLAESAEVMMRTIHLGLGAVGHLLARSSLDIQDGSVPADTMENLGFLMAELGDLAAECMRVAGECQSQLERPEGSHAQGT
jgi:hypothetical protein